MVDKEPPPERRDGLFLMRALVIAQETDTLARWRLALVQERIDPVEVSSALDGIRSATSLGFDLIVIAADNGAITPAEFIGLVRRGLFGSEPPPIIVQIPTLDSMLKSIDGAFAGCVVVAPDKHADLAHVIHEAFATIGTYPSDTGDDHA
jgi:hypothetical protein